MVGDLIVRVHAIARGRARRFFLIGAAAKKNRAGWPGFFCVELDAVTSQRGATGAEGCF